MHCLEGRFFSHKGSLISKWENPDRDIFVSSW